MKATVLQENLKNALGHLQKVIPSKPQMTVLSSIHITAKENTLILAATDLYLGVQTELLAEVEGEGVILVNGELFRSIINSLDKGKLFISLEENSLLIKQGKAISKLTCQNSEEFPEFPTVEGEKLSLNASGLDRIQELVSFSASADQSRPVLTALLMKFNQEALEVVSTDGFRLSHLLLKGQGSDQEKSVMLSSRSFGELCRLVKQAEVDQIQMIVSEELKQILVEFAHVKMFIRLIEGDYPPYEKIIPPSFVLRISFDSAEFLTQLKRAAIFSRDASNIVKLQISEDSMRISAQSPALGDYSGELMITNASKESGEIAFNVNYLIDFINATKPETLDFHMNESLKPAMFTDEKNKDYFYIAMPFRVNS